MPTAVEKLRAAAVAAGFHAAAHIPSPILGSEDNPEFLLHLKRM